MFSLWEIDRRVVLPTNFHLCFLGTSPLRINTYLFAVCVFPPVLTHTQRELAGLALGGKLTAGTPMDRNCQWMGEIRSHCFAWVGMDRGIIILGFFGGAGFRPSTVWFWLSGGPQSIHHLESPLFLTSFFRALPTAHAESRGVFCAYHALCDPKSFHFY